MRPANRTGSSNILQSAFGLVLVVGFWAAAISGIVKCQEHKVNRTPERWPEFKALRFAVTANLAVRSFEEKCAGLFGTPVTSTVLMVPFNREVLSAIHAYNARYERQFGTSGRRPGSDGAGLTGSDSVAFALFIINNQFQDSRSSVAVRGGLARSLSLQDEFGNVHRPARYTRNFDAPLAPGTNMGYVYFPHPPRWGSPTYTVHLDALRLSPCASRDSERQAAFMFDEHDVDYLALVRQGVDEASLAQHVPSLNNPDGFSAVKLMQNAATAAKLVNELIRLGGHLGLVGA